MPNCLTAIYSDEPIVGSTWDPVRLTTTLTKAKDPFDDNENGLRALCLWFNSTPGILSFLSIKKIKEGYAHFAVGDRNMLHVPNLRDMKITERLAKVQRELEHDEVQPFPLMDECDVREAMDDAVAEAVGLNKDTLSSWRRAIAQEPSVSQKSPLSL